MAFADLFPVPPDGTVAVKEVDAEMLMELSSNLPERSDYGTNPNPRETTRVIELMISSFERSRKMFLLRWKGQDGPKNAVVEGRVVRQVLSTLLYAQCGVLIGAYRRIILRGGPGKNEHCMVVFVREED